MRPIIGAIIVAAGALAAPLTLRAQEPAPAGGNKPRTEQPRPAPPRERPDRDRPRPEAKPDRPDQRRDPPDRPRSTGEPELKRRKPR